MKRIILFLCMWGCSLAYAVEGDAAPSFVLFGADLYTVSHGVIERGELLISNGKIAAVDTHVDAPAHIQRIDVTGKRIYPGYIAANSVLGLTEVELVRSTNDMAEVGMITPEVRAGVAINPDSELISVARANGVLSALVVPQAGPQGVIMGRSTLIQLDGWTSEAMTLEPAVGMNIFWPSERIPAGASQSVIDEIKEAARKKYDALNQALRDARTYQSAKRAGIIKTLDVRWESMLPGLDGKQPFFIHADEAVQIRQVLSFSEREKLRVILVGGADAWRFSDQLKAHSIPVILKSSHNLPLRRWESYDVLYSAAAKLVQAGVVVAIANDATSMAASNERNLPYQAASYAAFGLGEEAALRAITLAPAEILGVADRLGSLDIGKDATLFVADGNALEIRTHVEQAWIQGHRINLDNRQSRLYEKYQSKYQGKPKD